VHEAYQILKATKTKKINRKKRSACKKEEETAEIPQVVE
jgi:hypothetical protein